MIFMETETYINNTDFNSKISFIGEYMGIAITKMSANGQVVIPKEIREEAGIKPSTKFLVLNKDGNILLKQLSKKAYLDDLKLLQDIAEAEEDIKQGRYIKADTSMSNEEIVDLLTKQ